MNISIKNIEESLNLKKRKSPLIHCISNLFTINSLRSIIYSYDGRLSVSKDEDMVEEDTYKSNGVLINLENLSKTKEVFIEKSIRIALIRKLPIVLDLSGIDSFPNYKNLLMELLGRYEISVVIGTIEELNYLLEDGKNIDLENLKMNNIKENIELRKRIREFCKKYGTIALLNTDRYYLTDGFSEFYIGFLEDKIKSFKYVLPGLVSVGISTYKDKEKRFKGILISTMVMNVVNNEIGTLEREVELQDIVNSIQNISPKKINELSKVEYSFSR